MIATNQTTRAAARAQRLEKASVITWLSLALPLLVSAGLNLWNLTQNGLGDIYYSVAVQSMLLNWRNFFFAAYDAGGFISVDKPPVALWIQTISAKLLGFNSLALLLPEALAGIASVALLYFLVKRIFGTVAAFVAALALAITPIAVAVERDNETDSLLMLTLLLAAWAVTLAAEKGRFKLLALGMALVGVAFNIKMLEAWIVLPVFFLLYLIAAPINWKKRLLHLFLGGLIALSVSLSWAVAVDLTPAADRPWVGGGTSNSVLELAFGYNGLARITGSSQGGGASTTGNGGFNGGGNFSGNTQTNTQTGTQLNTGGPGATGGGQRPSGQGGGNFSGGQGGINNNGGLFGAGEAGLTRLFTGGVLAEQWSWLFPLGMFGVLATALALRRKLPLERRGQALLLWGGWLAIYGTVFSMASGTFHPYYLIMLAPAAAALAGSGVASLWSAYRKGGWQAWLLPVALLVTAVWQIKVLSAYPAWAVWLVPVALGGAVIAATPLIVTRMLPNGIWRRVAPVLVAVGLIALAVSPAVWSVTPVLAAPNNASLPVSGPDSLTDISSSWTKLTSTVSSGLLSYLETNSAGYTYLVAVSNAQEASALTLDSGKAVLAAGGFMGTDPALTAEKLAQMVAANEIRFVLGLTSGNNSSTSDVSQWIQANCVAVAASAYGGTTSTNGQSGGSGGSFLSGLSGTLYDCAAQ